MNYAVATLISVAILAAILAAMAWGWRRRRARDAGLVAWPVPAGTAATETADALYVATTRSGEPLERLGIRGLDFRGKAEIAVAPTGVSLAIVGQEPLWLPAAALRGAGTATYAIDRGVETGGLLAITWQPDGSAVAADSYLRITDTADRDRVLDAITAIVPTNSSTTTTESEA